ncbi:MAG: endonuclease/exonuclease/phosphatase family protein [Gemmatimonadaceae bacterium]
MVVRLLSYNIRFGGVGREEALASVIRAADPDVVMLQEATDAGVVARVAEAAGLPRWASQPAHSTAFMSRLPVAHHAWHRPPAARHPFLEVVLGDGESRVFGLHLSARFSKWSERRRAREIRALLDGIHEYEHGFHLLVGDFNALAPGERLQVARMPAWIRALVWVSGRDIARETIQTMLDARYADGYRALHPDDAGYTFPVWDPHVRLDYAFLPQRYVERVKSCEVVREPEAVKRASDHYPLMTVVEVG